MAFKCSKCFRYMVDSKGFQCFRCLNPALIGVFEDLDVMCKYVENNSKRIHIYKITKTDGSDDIDKNKRNKYIIEYALVK